jgi:hypothetical protein
MRNPLANTAVLPLPDLDLNLSFQCVSEILEKKGIWQLASTTKTTNLATV